MTAPVFEEKPIPTWQKIGAGVYVIVTVTLVVVFRDRLHADFWPLDAARVSPNILATVIQILLWAPVAVLLWPPTRRRFHRFISAHTESIHQHLQKVEEQREKHHAEHMQKLEEIHNHIRKTHPLK